MTMYNLKMLVDKAYALVSENTEVTIRGANASISEVEELIFSNDETEVKIISDIMSS